MNFSNGSSPEHLTSGKMETPVIEMSIDAPFQLLA